jgi:hypothetical protein
MANIPVGAGDLSLLFQDNNELIPNLKDISMPQYQKI